MIYTQLPTTSLEETLRKSGSTESFIKEVQRKLDSHAEMLRLLKQIQEEFDAGRTLGMTPGSTFALNVRDAIAHAEDK